MLPPRFSIARWIAIVVTGLLAATCVFDRHRFDVGATHAASVDVRRAHGGSRRHRAPRSSAPDARSSATP